jgi:hypothetical protein
VADNGGSIALFEEFTAVSSAAAVAVASVTVFRSVFFSG